MIAVIADTHLPRGRRWLPQRCIELIRQAGLVLHAGDIATPKALAAMADIGPSVVAVHGNVDSPSLRAALPRRRLLEVHGVRLGMIHDPGPARDRLDRLRELFPTAAAVVFGHTHLPEHRNAGGFQIFNPGSPTERRQAPNRTMGLARIVAGEVVFEHVPLPP